MSGIAIAASTIPGSVATFWSCSSDRSARSAARSSSSANTRAGTRMSARAVAGISYSVSSMGRGSDIEHDARLPHGTLLRESQPMIGRRLHERLDLAAPADEDVGGAAGDQRLEHVFDSAQRNVPEIDVDVVPLLEP